MQDGLWHTVVGAMQSCQGSAALYSSPDFRSWRADGAWATQVRANFC
jgi:sucrose-6-phosphate hydrolase SacC (GH32 family)